MSDIAIGQYPASRARPYRILVSGGDDNVFITLPGLDRDGIASFVLFASMLFIVQLGSYGALLFSAATAIYAGVRWRTLRAAMQGRWFLLAFPGFAMLSVIWSDAPFETLKHSAEYALTIFAALLVVSARNPRSVLLGLFWAFAIYSLMSIAVGNMVDVGDTGARALAGLNDSKNEEADMAATGLTISVFVFVMELRARRLLRCAAAEVAIIVQTYIVIAALSAGAVAGAAVAIATFAGLLLLRKAGHFARAAVMAGAGVFAGSAAAVFVLFPSDVLDWLATFFDKDMTLTGRTYLWARARDLVADHPLFGQGFAAFWQQGNLDAEGLWQFAQITTRDGFNFHSTFYETLVGLGWIGVIILGIVFVIGLTKLTVSYVRRPTYLTCFWLAMAAYMFIRMPAECMGLNEFYFSTVLIFALLGAAQPSAIAIRVKRLVSRRPNGAAPFRAGQFSR